MKTRKISPIAITLGEPGGIGPRLILESCRDLIREDKNFFFLIADFSQMQPLAEYYDCPIEIIKGNEIPDSNTKALRVYNFSFPEGITPGVVNSKHSESILGMIKTAVNLIHNGSASAMVTGPINKSSISKTLDIEFRGHTEFLSKLDKNRDNPVMMMQSDNFRVVPLTHHIPLSSVPALITKKHIKETARTVHYNLTNLWKIKNPRIFISGLNPHAGENGSLGLEETSTINPAIKELKDEGIEIFGPYSADTLFTAKMREAYDVVICMYHDQALIPIKSLFFESTINITLGLSIIRTSPGHGTALNMVNAKEISNISFKNALLEAYKLAIVKHK